VGVCNEGKGKDNKKQGGASQKAHRSDRRDWAQLSQQPAIKPGGRCKR